MTKRKTDREPRTLKFLNCTAVGSWKGAGIGGTAENIIIDGLHAEGNAQGDIRIDEAESVDIKNSTLLSGGNASAVDAHQEAQERSRPRKKYFSGWDPPDKKHEA
jgi:hypothetical protein